MPKKKNLTITGHFKENGPSINKIIEDTFYIYFQEQYTNIIKNHD